MTLRLLVGSLCGLAISMLIFWFMIRLIANDQSQMQVDQAVTQLQLYEPPPEPEQEPEEPPPPQETNEQVNDQPQMDVPALAAADPIGTPVVDMPALDMAIAGLDMPAVSGTWSAPLKVDEGSFGKKGEGYIEVVPISTRRPNIPEIAWEKKINGWVLVAFTLTPGGITKNVRVLDAYPRGVFEEKAIKAVEDWIYDMKDVKVKGDILLTQKIELNWKHYPENNNHLDD